MSPPSVSLPLAAVAFTVSGAIALWLWSRFDGGADYAFLSTTNTGLEAVGIAERQVLNIGAVDGQVEIDVADDRVVALTGERQAERRGLARPCA